MRPGTASGTRHKRKTYARESARRQRRNHEIYKDLKGSIPPGLSPAEYAKRQRHAADQAEV